MNQIKFIFLDTNCLFNKIAKYNNQELLIPVNVKKTKLNSDIIDDIFNNFTFKKIKKESCSWLILKEIYNVYFNTNVIEVVPIIGDENQKSKNVKYETRSILNDYIEFLKENLIIRPIEGLTYNDLQSINKEIYQINNPEKMDVSEKVYEAIVV